MLCARRGGVLSGWKKEGPPAGERVAWGGERGWGIGRDGGVRNRGWTDPPASGAGLGREVGSLHVAAPSAEGSPPGRWGNRHGPAWSSSPGSQADQTREDKSIARANAALFRSSRPIC